MNKEGNKKLKYVAPECETMEFSPGCILAGSSDPGGWSLDDSDGNNTTGASSGTWGIDGSSTGASSSSTGASTGAWSTD